MSSTSAAFFLGKAALQYCLKSIRLNITRERVKNNSSSKGDNRFLEVGGGGGIFDFLRFCNAISCILREVLYHKQQQTIIL